LREFGGRTAEVIVNECEAFVIVGLLSFIISYILYNEAFDGFPIIPANPARGP
jgi:hypothetical protein